MKIYIWIHLLCLPIYVYSNIYGHLNRMNEKNKTYFKFVAFNRDNQNYVCIIVEMNLTLIMKSVWANITEDAIRLNSSISGNCSTFTRQLIIKTGPVEINFVWIRDPDPYEFGEVGWSSVGAPANTTSGTYTLSKIFVTVPLSKLTNNYKNDHKIYSRNFDPERFKTRSGDYYVCETRIGLDMLILNSSVYPMSNIMTVRLEFENMRLQLFSDVNVSDFTGTGQMCLNDLPSDSGVSIGIGVAVSVLVVAVLAFLAIGRLKEKDQQYEEIDTTKWIPPTKA